MTCFVSLTREAVSAALVHWRAQRHDGCLAGVGMCGGRTAAVHYSVAGPAEVPTPRPQEEAAGVHCSEHRTQRR